jgi:hypothetical protein
MTNTIGLSLNDLHNELDTSTLEDQTVSTGGTYESVKIPRGKHPVRLIEYVEFGMHPQKPWQGEERPDADQVMLTFEFLGKRTVTENEDGIKTAMRKSVYMKKSTHEKASFRKLFEKMRGGDTSITNMAQMVGKGSWLLTVQWTQGKEVLNSAEKVTKAEAALKADKDNKDLRIWDNIRNEEGYMLTQAVSETFDDETGETIVKPISVPPVISPLRVFLWDNPSAMFWNSLFIEGSYTRTVDGKEVEVSKNRLQNKIMEATNYEGSPIANFVEGLDNLGDTVTAEPKKETKAKKEAPKESTESDEDLMNDLGL